jgi:hypothetical protein
MGGIVPSPLHPRIMAIPRLCPVCGSAFVNIATADAIAKHFGIHLHIPGGVDVYVCSQAHFFLDRNAYNAASLNDARFGERIEHLPPQ